MQSNYPNFDEQHFKGNVDSAVKSVERILNIHRNPRLAEDVDHEYENKYDLANLLSNTWLIAQMNCLERMGLTAEILRGIDKSQSTTLRFQATTFCSFLRKMTLQVPMQQTQESVETTVTVGSPFSGNTTKSTISRVINNINEYHWKVEVQWQVALYSGSDVDATTTLQTRSSSTIVVIQTNEQPPLPERQDHEPCDVSLTWILQNIDNEALTARFKIDTQHPDTKTPSRNRIILEAIDFTKDLTRWSIQVERFFKVFVWQRILDLHNPAGPQTPKSKAMQLAQVSALYVFNPIQPLLEEPSNGTEEQNEMTVDSKSVLAWNEKDPGTNDNPSNPASGKSPLLSINDMHKFLNEQIRTLDEKSESLRRVFPSGDMVKLVSVVEATIMLICDHSKRLNLVYTNSIMYIEKMLENQLNAAIGKRVNADDLDKFVKFHNAKFLDPAPAPFCRSIRRPDHYPDGILSIENAGDKKEHIETFVREMKMKGSLKIPLSAAATLELTGPTFLHGWLRHRFQQAHKSFEIVARARQFSSFMLVVGTMVGSDRLQPQDAIILQNKDEVIIPLLLDEIPSANEFKDAIKSLSPEQQRFAKAFRGMQLESSVLGICVVQIKPQLEKLLGLPPDALTKEIQLIQYLMKMFVEYQVPSDLLSYDGGDSNSTVKERVDNVKTHVQVVADVIATANMNDWEAGAMRATAAAHAAAERAFGGAPAPAPFGGGSMFGSAAASGGFFGGPPPLAPSGGSAFGAPAPAPGAFGASPQGGGGASLFGTPPVAVQSPNAANTSTSFSFGSPVPASSATTAPAPNASLIGAPARAQLATHPPAPTGVGDADVVSPQPEGQVANGTNLDSEPSTGDSRGDPFDPSDEVSELLSKVKVDGVTDFTSLPKLLDSIIEHHNTDGALRSTVIKTGNIWDRLRQPNLLMPATITKLSPQSIKSEKDRAFDLLDALSRSGSLPIACSELHVVVCLTHCFEKDVVSTVIQDNVNPIEKLEMSTLLLASVVHGVAPKDLIRGSKDVNRLSASFPELLA